MEGFLNIAESNKILYGCAITTPAWTPLRFPIHRLVAVAVRAPSPHAVNPTPIASRVAATTSTAATAAATAAADPYSDAAAATAAAVAVTSTASTPVTVTSTAAAVSVTAVSDKL